MHLIHNGSVGQGSPIEHQVEAQTEVEVEEVEEAEEAEEVEDSQEQQETQMIEIDRKSVV